MDRFKQGEKLAAAAREGLPSVAVQWLAAARKPLEKLTKAALNGDVSDEEFVALVEEFSKSLPSLLDEMDHDALATHMENSMGAAMANGMAAREKQKAESGKLKEEKRAKLPWETGVWLGGGIKRDKDGKFAKTNETTSRKKLRRKPTRREKIEMERKHEPVDMNLAAAVVRYRKGVSVPSPTGRSVTFGNRAADHLQQKEKGRARFADLAEATISNPSSIWQDGLRCRYLKLPGPGGRNGFLVVTQIHSDSTEDVVTFTKQSPNKKNPPGRRIYPAD